jgi:hypothetical protein
MTPARPTSAVRRRGGAPGPFWRWLLPALVIAGAQALLAVHQVGHLSDGPGPRHCQICVLGGGLAHAAVSAGLHVPALPQTPESAPAPLPVFRTRVAIACRIRGPPTPPLSA